MLGVILCRKSTMLEEYTVGRLLFWKSPVLEEKCVIEYRAVRVLFLWGKNSLLGESYVGIVLCRE